MEVVVNRCFGGFSLSKEAVLWARAHGATWAEEIVLPEDASPGKRFFIATDSYRYYPKGGFDNWDNWRADPTLVECVNTLGEKSWGRLAKLKVVTIPDDVAWEIEDYDGQEHVAEVHRT